MRAFHRTVDFLHNSWLWIREQHTSGNSVHPTPAIYKRLLVGSAPRDGNQGEDFQEDPWSDQSFITLFDRRMDFLKTKRGNMAHSDFLLLLENKRIT